ncbi:hypothetical protein AB6Q70_000510 [Escherichia coli]
MSKKKGKTPQPAAKTMTASAPKMEAFTFGEPVPVHGLIFLCISPISGNRLPLTTSIESPFIARCLSRNGIVLAQVPAKHNQNAHV